MLALEYKQFLGKSARSRYPGVDESLIVSRRKPFPCRVRGRRYSIGKGACRKEEVQGGTMQRPNPVVLRLCDEQFEVARIWLVHYGEEGRKVQY